MEGLPSALPCSRPSLLLPCRSRSAPPTLETIRPKQEWETRLNRIRKTKESVRVSAGQGRVLSCGPWAPHVDCREWAILVLC